MDETPRAPHSIFRHDLDVSNDVIDADGHASNIAFLEWVQEAAASHARATGVVTATEAAGG